MKIVWDEPKRLANLEKHGLDFADLNETFFDNALVIPSHNAGKRWVAIGVNIHGVIVVVFAARPDAKDVSHHHDACGPQAGMKGNSMPNAKRTGYSKKDLRDVSDNPELTKADFAKAKPFAEVFSDLAASIRKGRGPEQVSGKETCVFAS